MAPFKVEFNVLYVDAQSNYPLGMESDNRYHLYNLIIYIYIFMMFLLHTWLSISCFDYQRSFFGAKQLPLHLFQFEVR